MNTERRTMGKICPRCNYHIEDEPQPWVGCQHEFDLAMDNLNTSGTSKKWRCKKCLEVRYTHD